MNDRRITNRPMEPQEEREFRQELLTALNEVRLGVNRIDARLKAAEESWQPAELTTVEETDELPAIPRAAVGDNATVETVQVIEGGETVDPTVSSTTGSEAEKEAAKAAKDGGKKGVSKSPEAPWEGFDTMPVNEIVERAKKLDKAGRDRILAHERANAKRADLIEILVNWNS